MESFKKRLISIRKLLRSQQMKQKGNTFSLQIELSPLLSFSSSNRL